MVKLGFVFNVPHARYFVQCCALYSTFLKIKTQRFLCKRKKFEKERAGNTLFIDIQRY